MPADGPTSPLIVEAKPEASLSQPLSIPNFASFTSLGSLALILNSAFMTLSTSEEN